MLITPGELQELGHEGIPMHFMVAPVAYVGEGGRVRAMRFVRTELGAPDAGGRRRPVEVPGSEFEIPADTVLLATGQFPDAGWIGGEWAATIVGPDGWLKSGASARTAAEKIFVAGDFAGGAASLIQAIGHAKQCAREVDRFLMGAERLRDAAVIDETKDYVPKLIAAALIAKQPEKYGFPRVEGVAALAYDSIIVPDATGLDVIARLADTSLSAIRELNPQFIRHVTPPKREVVVRLPPGTASVTWARYEALPARERVTFIEHTVARGETVSGIAQSYRVSTRLVLDANPGIKPSQLRPGSRLVIPTSYVPPTSEKAPAPRARASGTRRWLRHHPIPGSKRGVAGAQTSRIS